MLITEWNTEDALAVRFEEGWEGGREEGWEEGREEGREEIVRNALGENLPVEMIHKITGLDMEAIKDIQARL